MFAGAVLCRIAVPCRAPEKERGSAFVNPTKRVSCSLLGFCRPRPALKHEPFVCNVDSCRSVGLLKSCIQDFENKDGAVIAAAVQGLRTFVLRHRRFSDCPSSRSD